MLEARIAEELSGKAEMLTDACSLLRRNFHDLIIIMHLTHTLAGLNNPSRAWVFYIDHSNCKFRFRQMKEFITS